MHRSRLFATLLLPLLSFAPPLTAEEGKDSPPMVTLFDGKSLDGWQIRKGEEKWWKLQDGMIEGGSTTEMVPYNSFISTAKRYGNFELHLKLKLVKEGAGEGFMNSGVQIRSVRVKGSSEMTGFQVDAGIGYWGTLYDESRRNKQLAGPIDAEAIKTAAKDWDWNDYRIVCEGGRIRSWINGVPAVDYTESDAKLPQEGYIGLQIHAGGKAMVQIKDIQIRELPTTPDAPKWSDEAAKPDEPSK